MRKYGKSMIASVLIIVAVLVGCAAPASVPQAPAPTSEKPIELKLSYHMPQQSFIGHGILEPWTKEIEEATGGRVKITSYSGGTLATQKDQYDALISGLCDIAPITADITPGVFPLSEINTLPGLFPSGEVVGRAFHELLNEYCVDTELSKTKLLFVIPMGTVQLFTNKPVQKLEDLKGMKLFSSGRIETLTAEALGATGLLLDISEVYTSLERGLLDGVPFIWEGGIAFGFFRITKYRTKCDLQCRAFPVLMNKDAWNKLPKDIQDIFEQHSNIEVSALYGAAFDKALDEAMKRIQSYDEAAGNPGIYFLSDAEKARWQQAYSKVWDQWVDERESMGLPARDMLNDALRLVEQYSK